MVVLLARLHLIGFLWGDVSLSNTLFRRDAGAFAAYLVDAETGELHDELTNGQREHDLAIARTNLFGEFCDLEAGGLLDEALDPLVLVETIENRYRELWAELTGVEEFDGTEMHRIESRVRRLNALGFDVAELDITTDFAGSTIRIQPKVVDAGHHSRRLIRLTGLDTEENQARRLLNDLDSYRARTDQQGADESIVAHQWLTDRFEPVRDERAQRAARQAGAGRALPRGAGAPLVPQRAGRVGGPDQRRGRQLHAHRAAPAARRGGCPVRGRDAMGPLANPYDPSQGFADDADREAVRPVGGRDGGAGGRGGRRGNRRPISTSPPLRNRARQGLKRPPRVQRLARSWTRRVRSARRHPEGAVEPDHLAVQQRVGDDCCDQQRVLRGPAEPGRVRHQGLQDSICVSPGRPAIIGVSITPGAIVITRIALSARSRAALSVSEAIPPLLAA